MCNSLEVQLVPLLRHNCKTTGQLYKKIQRGKKKEKNSAAHKSKIVQEGLFAPKVFCQVPEDLLSTPIHILIGSNKIDPARSQT